MDCLTVYKSGKVKRRIGNPKGDGGYIIAELPDSYDGFISGGIGNNISFEFDLLSLYENLKGVAFDGTIDTLPQYHDRLKFIKKNLNSKKSDNAVNLAEFVVKQNMFLKLDIEGFEFKVLPELIKEDKLKYFKQMVIEFHTPADINKHKDYYSSELFDVTNKTMQNLIEDINKTHTLIHFHGNPVPGTHELSGIVIPNVFECTFVRNDFIKEKVKNSKPVPTPLDRPNLPGYSELDLNYEPFVTVSN